MTILEILLLTTGGILACLAVMLVAWPGVKSTYLTLKRRWYQRRAVRWPWYGSNYKGR